MVVLFSVLVVGQSIEQVLLAQHLFRRKNQNALDLRVNLLSLSLHPFEQKFKNLSGGCLVVVAGLEASQSYQVGGQLPRWHYRFLLHIGDLVVYTLGAKDLCVFFDFG